MIEEQDIIQILNPFLDQIENKELQTKVIKTWMEGCRQGGRSPQDDSAKSHPGGAHCLWTPPSEGRP